MIVHFRNMSWASAGLGVALIAGAVVAQPRPQVQVEHAAARLVVIAEPRNDISVDVRHGPNGLPTIVVRREAGRIMVDGGLGSPGRRLDCVGGINTTHTLRFFARPDTRVGDTRAVIVGGVGRVPFAQLPVITAHVPLDARLATGGAVWGDVGASRSLSLQTAGCGDWTVGRVQGSLDVQSEGSGDVRASDVGLLHASISGSGDLGVGRVAGPLDIAMHGSGDVEAGAVGGPVQLALSGSGDVKLASVAALVRAQLSGSSDAHIRGGRAPQVQVNVSGSGDFDFAGVAGSLQAAVEGSGDVHVARVDGPVSKSVAGSGEVTVGP